MKRVLLAGLLGGLTMMVWLVVVDGLFGVKRDIEMNELRDERTVYSFLVAHITEPGRYVVNPEVVPEQGFPGHDPIFAVHYTGLGHADAGKEMLAGLLVALLSCTLGAGLLAHASVRVRSRFATRLGFFTGIGLVAALLLLGARFGLASYSMGDALALATHDLAAWVLMGLVVAGLVKPVAEEVATASG
ncbi:MAG: hypothetical protein LJF04_11725 [Gemmatimonadetes bacterium]|nr:hypothetical protein [Gemmatimonadota bacterium]